MTRKVLYDVYKYGTIVKSGAQAKEAAQITKTLTGNINTYAQRGFKTQTGYVIKLHGEPYKTEEKAKSDPAMKEFWIEWERVTRSIRKTVKWVKHGGKKLTVIPRIVAK